MRRRHLKRTAQWLPTVTVLVVVLLAGARLIQLSTHQRALEMRSTAGTSVVEYAHAIETQLQDIAERAGTEAVELDQLLSQLELGQLIDADYDFELAKVDDAGRRAFVSTLIAPIEDGAAATIGIPPTATQDAPGRVELAIRPKGGWYPARELAAAIALLAVVAWLLAFATHDLVHSMHRAHEAVALARRQLQLAKRKLAAEIEQHEKLQRSFEHSRYHDSFTGLPNRRYFMDQLDRALREIRTRRRQRLAVMLIGIDRFKLISETLGHTAGDELVVQAARRFQRAASSVECVLARWSGNQFAILIFDVASLDAALEAAAHFQEALREPFDLRKHRLSVAARFGVTCVESGLHRAEEVIREADIALSVAKRQETASAVAYQPAMGGSAASLVSLEADLHVALERRELHLLMQPIVDLTSRRAAGVEALLRWRHPVEGMLTPDKFIGVAEEVGLIVPITRWTILNACMVAAEWRQRLPSDRSFYVSINLSPAALRDPELSAYVAQALQQTGARPETLKLELTESGLISHPGAARETLDELHDLGVEMMLDDFGTGYSSLSHLQLFPFDYVKIDRPLVGRTGSQRANSAIAAAIVQMAASLGLKSVAEIVETDEAAENLQKMGCNFAQGYFYCAPIEAEDALQVLLGSGRAVTPRPAVAYEDDSPTMISEQPLALSEQTLILDAELVAAEMERKREADAGWRTADRNA
jgi:diguanylate cyclase (GGDEF)-like protein